MERSLVCLLRIAVITLAVTGMGLPQDTRASFAITISAPHDVVKVGAAAIVHISLENTSTKAIVIVSESLAESGQQIVPRGDRDFDIEVRDAQGARPPETQYFRAVQGKDPHMIIMRSWDSSLLKPKQALKGKVDLTKLFDLKPGTYTVQLRRRDYDRKTVVNSNTITITVTP